MSDIDDLLEKNGACFVRVEGNAGPSEDTRYATSIPTSGHRTYVIALIAAKLEDYRRVQSTCSEKSVPSGHVVERSPDVLCSGDTSSSIR